MLWVQSLGWQDPLEGILALENPRNRGAWQATVHREAQSWTRLKSLSIRSWFTMLCTFFLIYSGLFSSNLTASHLWLDTQHLPFKTLFIFWLSWVSAECGLSLAAVGEGYLHGVSFSLWWLLLLQVWGSRASGLSTWSVALWHGGPSWTRDQTHVPCIGRWVLNHCTTSKVPTLTFSKGRTDWIFLWA